MKSASAKAKGRALQKWVKEMMHRVSGLPDSEILSRSSGSNGEDVILSKKARLYFPISAECKNRAKFSVYKDYDQAWANNPNPSLYGNAVFIKQNKREPLVIVDALFFLNLLGIRYNALSEETKKELEDLYG